MCPDWNQLFLDPSKIIRQPDPLGTAMIAFLPPRSVVFDHGCGAGRHLVQLAQAGLRVIGGDIAPVGMVHSREWLSSQGLSADLLLNGMIALPFVDASLDAVLSINVLNHGTVAQTRTAFDEVHRVLKPGGPFFFVIIGREDARYGEGEEIEPHTFIPRQGIEAGVPHHYYMREELEEMLADFSRTEFEERRRPYDVNEPVFGNDPRLKHQKDTLQHWAVKAWK